MYGASMRRAIRQLHQPRIYLERTALLQTRSFLQPHPRFSSTATTTPNTSTTSANTPTPTPSQVTASIKADAPQTFDADPEEPSVSAKKAREKLERAVKKNLPYLDDPWKLGQYVTDALAKDRFDEALLLTQKASNKDQVVVSWNHLIDYQLEKQQLRKAIKLYNEVSASTVPIRGVSNDILTPNPDEEAGSAAQYANLHDYIPRTRQVTTPQISRVRGHQALSDPFEG